MRKESEKLVNRARRSVEKLQQKMNYRLYYVPDGVPFSTVQTVGVAARKTLGALYDLGWQGMPEQSIYISNRELPAVYPDGKQRWVCGNADSIEGRRVTVNDGSIRAWLNTDPSQPYERILQEVVGHEIVHNAFISSPPSILERSLPQNHGTFFDYETDLREMFTESLTSKILVLTK